MDGKREVALLRVRVEQAALSARAALADSQELITQVRELVQESKARSQRQRARREERATAYN